MRFLITTFMIFIMGHQGVALPFPQDYLGKWKGECVSLNPKAESSQFSVSLEVAKISEYHFKWKTIYHSDSLHQARDYSLKLNPEAPGQFVIDENNGLLLDGFAAGNKMHELFSLTSGVVIYVTYEIRGKTLLISLPSWTTKSPRITSTPDNNNTVYSYKITGIQECHLIKIGSTRLFTN